jgi:hypothetical protein
MAYSRLALQTQDLDAQETSFAGIWGDFGGTLRRHGAFAQKLRTADARPKVRRPAWEVIRVLNLNHLRVSVAIS